MCRENKPLNLLGKEVIPFDNSARFISGPCPTKSPVLVPYRINEKDTVSGGEKHIHSYTIVKNPYVRDGETYIHVLSPITRNVYEIRLSERLLDTVPEPEITCCKKCCQSDSEMVCFLLPTSACIYRTYPDHGSRRVIDGKLMEYGTILDHGYFWREVVLKNGVECVRESGYWTKQAMKVINQFTMCTNCPFDPDEMALLD